MLFDKTDKTLMRHSLTDLMQHIITAMRFLEVENTSLTKRADAAHKELYKAMETLVDASVATDYEYHYMLDVSSIKVRAISKGMPSTLIRNESNPIPSRHPTLSAC